MPRLQGNTRQRPAIIDMFFAPQHLSGLNYDPLIDPVMPLPVAFNGQLDIVLYRYRLFLIEDHTKEASDYRDRTLYKIKPLTNEWSMFKHP